MVSKDSGNKTFDALKDLLIKPEKGQIKQIENRLDDPMIRAKEISRSLPEAISLSVLRNNKLSLVIQPVIDESIKQSVKNNPKALADAIFPALGPGIRKAIASTIMGMIQSLNQVLNHSFSFQGLKWRFEAFKTGKQFAEIVLLHTLVYKVEQIFLIHKDTGIVLDHVVAKDTIIQDPDLVSGMLTAIQDFVSDSFHSETKDDIETLRIGSDRSVWIEKGESAFIAAVIQGTPPLDLRHNYREMIDEIHIKSGMSLEKFDGDPTPFSIFRELLKTGLQFQAKNEQKKISPLLWCTVLITLSLLGLWGANTYKTHQVWAHYLKKLENQKGLIILSTEKKGGEYQISGFKDPLAKDPLSLLTDEDKTRIAISSHWKTFYSLDPEIILKRARQILTPPSTIELTLSKNNLIAKGRASNDWISSFRDKAKQIAGIERIDYGEIQNIDKERLDIELTLISKIRIYFKNGSTTLIEGQEKQLNQVFQAVQTIQTLHSKLKSPVQIVILGHTDSSGTEKQNFRLSRARAERILNHLIIKGINPTFFTLSGVGTKLPLKNETDMDDRQYNRAVTFKIFYTPST